MLNIQRYSKKLPTTYAKFMVNCEKRRVNLRAFVWSPLFAGRADTRGLWPATVNQLIFFQRFSVFGGARITGVKNLFIRKLTCSLMPYGRNYILLVLIEFRRMSENCFKLS